jgi:hypothetical protein
MGAVFWIPTLLLREPIVDHGFPDILSTVSNSSIVREELFDGEICYVIKARLSEVPWLMWIGKSSHLLRKTRTWYSPTSFNPLTKNLKDAFVAEEIHNNIRVNRAIPKAFFRYRPVFGPKDVDLTTSRRSQGAK